MTTLTKIIVTTILSLTLFSCNFDFNFGVHGDKNVVTQERALSGSFSEIRAARGLDVIITQGTSESVSVEADENLQDIIVVKVEGNLLNITTTENIASSASKKVYVTFDDLSKVISESGSDIHSTGTISAENLDIESSSGSDIELTINANQVSCDSSSGSEIKLSGKANSIYAQASSGADIETEELETQSAHAKASSGADITVNTTTELNANVSSGGTVKYKGNPTTVNKKDSTSGSIQQL